MQQDNIVLWVEERIILQQIRIWQEGYNICPLQELNDSSHIIFESLILQYKTMNYIEVENMKTQENS